MFCLLAGSLATNTAEETHFLVQPRKMCCLRTFPLYKKAKIYKEMLGIHLSPYKVYILSI